VLTFQQILREEEAMASWLNEQLPMLVQERLQQVGASG
jgi:ferritin-like metal-binding protein YciE